MNKHPELSSSDLEILTFLFKKPQFCHPLASVVWSVDLKSEDIRSTDLRTYLDDLRQI